MSIFSTGKPFVIAGPCSAETREQVLATAAALATLPVQLFRAGVWKPRTRPGSFEGNGFPALEWLQEARKTYGLKFTVEVAEVQHVELALAAGADVLWIGARTTVNPFQVQHLADAMKGSNVPVMVKNPVNPDVDLWIGAIERMEKAGLETAAIHRGFSGYSSAAGYRNQPNWPIPIELKRRRPDIALICDPSHITGDRARVEEVSQKAMDMNFDGLMIETHPDPANAWSDAAQQITPVQLADLLKKLVIRSGKASDMNSQVELEYLRQQMDTLDAEIIDLIARRMEISGKIGTLKKACNMPAFLPGRWREIVAATADRAQKQSLSPEFIADIYEKIHHESIRRQLIILEGE